MRSAASMLVVFAAVACGDPVHDDAVSALGPEAAGVPPGPTHRPGQPCLTCHGSEGPASFRMSFGGTVYATLDDPAPGAGAAVRLLDANQQTYDTTANCVGNFWVPAGEYSATYPVTGAVTLNGFSRVMTTRMRREGSCAACHTSPPSSASPGQLFALPAGSDLPQPTCNKNESPTGVAAKIPACSTATPDCSTPRTFAKDVSPVIKENCANCHQRGGETPTPALIDLTSVKKNSMTAYSLISACSMPPPPLDQLTDDEKAIFECWYAQGMKP